ncbi:hypothetical protein [Notoacmeibacter marinus]|uniref:hypothetical protein n=1 Tax=Notoacmeibacter marinus TaxID=1876515 RepID=UPI000DF491ED|nr:hypothetical protein [Notoacmeibacter marinus]
MGRLLFAIVLFAIGFLGAVWLTAVSTDRKIGDLLSQNTLRQLLSGEEIALDTPKNGVSDEEGAGAAATPDGDDEAGSAQQDKAAEPGNDTTVLADAGPVVDTSADAGRAATDGESPDKPAEASDKQEMASTSDGDSDIIEGFAFEAIAPQDDGRIVVSGSAPAETPVELLAGDAVLATGDADADGRFSIETDKPMRDGETSLTLRSQTEGGTPVVSPETTVVNVPEETDGAWRAEATNSITDESRDVLAKPDLSDPPATVPDDGQTPGDNVGANAEIAAASDAGSEPVSTQEEEAATGRRDVSPAPDVNAAVEGDLAGADPREGDADRSSTEGSDTAGAADEQQSTMSPDSSEVDSEEVAVAPTDGEAAVTTPTDSADNAPVTDADQPTESEDAPVAGEEKDEEASGTEVSVSESMPAEQPVPDETLTPSQSTDMASADTAATAEDGAQNKTAEPVTTSAETTDEPAEAMSSPATPLVEAVEIDGGSVFVTGSAAPQTRLRIFAGETEIGEVQVNESGRFLMEAEAEIPVGKVPLRIEMLDEGGAVEQTLVSSFERTAGERMTAIAEPPSTDPEMANRTASDAAEVMVNASDGAKADRESEATAPVPEETQATDPDETPAPAPSREEAVTAKQTPVGKGADDASPAATTDETPAETEPSEPMDSATSSEDGPGGETARSDTADTDESSASAARENQQPETALSSDSQMGGEDGRAADDSTADAMSAETASGEDDPAASDSAFERARSAVERAGSALRGMMADEEADESEGAAAQDTESNAAETDMADAETPSSDAAPAIDQNDAADEAADPASSDASPGVATDTEDGDRLDSAEAEPDVMLPAMPPVFEVRPGDTVRSLSRRLYGQDAKDADFVNVETGKVVRPDDLRAGMRLRLPEEGPDGRTADLDGLGSRLISDTDK